jgi:hypothetical protein
VENDECRKITLEGNKNNNTIFFAKRQGTFKKIMIIYCKM